jgi:hypothetical protein
MSVLRDVGQLSRDSMEDRVRSGVAVGRRIRTAVSNTAPVSSLSQYREESMERGQAGHAFISPHGHPEAVTSVHHRGPGVVPAIATSNVDNARSRLLRWRSTWRG